MRGTANRNVLIIVFRCGTASLLTIHMDVDKVFRKAYGYGYGYTYIDISEHTQLHYRVQNQILLSEIKFMKMW